MVRSPIDAALLAAHAAYADADAERLAQQAERLVGSPFAAYAEYWQASLRLRAAVPDDAGVRPFLARYPGSVLADRLLAEWLPVLAARGDFVTFAVQRPGLVQGGDEPKLACYTLLARYALDDPNRDGGRGREQLVRAARQLLAVVSDPGSEGCTALADRLLDDGLLSPWVRLQALVERNQISAAESVAQQRMSAAAALACKTLLRGPADWLAAVDAGLEHEPHAWSLLAIVALARDDTARAAQLAARLDPELRPEERALVWGRIGRVAEYKLLPDAHAWFERGGELVGLGIDYIRAPEVLEAQARAALRRGAALAPPAQPAVSASGAIPAPAAPGPGPDWYALRRAIAHMGAEQQADSTWVYWNAQAALALGLTAEGHAGLQSIAGRFGFYGRLAAEQLGAELALPPRPEAPAAALVEDLAQRPGLQCALHLFALGLRDEANRQWNWELRSLDDGALRAAAELARRHRLYDRMIATSERIHGAVDMAQRYPMPYRKLMAQTAAPLGVDTAWVYGLIRQESRFVEDIRSSSGAVGLMQLMPATARFVAHKIGLERYRADRIGDVPVNLRLGVAYLKLIADDQDGRPLLAAAAYNAGPTRVRRWRAALARPLDGVIFAETIPIAETRDYVKKVLFNTVIYAAQLERRDSLLRALLQPVSPKGTPPTDLP